ncbi:MAG: hypothetical protein IIC10_01260 [Proteobacteria bacterium]|nr:hypothetical protein [Pseudomonadota bacterium]
MKDSPSPSQKSRAWIVVVYLVLLTLLIPWYWPENDSLQLFGFPLWALVSLAVLFAASLFTAWLCLRSEGPAE